MKKARLSKVGRQILQNQGAIMMALKMLGEALLKRNMMYNLSFGGLEEATRNTCSLMSGEILPRRKKR